MLAGRGWNLCWERPSSACPLPRAQVWERGWVNLGGIARGTLSACAHTRVWNVRQKGLPRRSVGTYDLLTSISSRVMQAFGCTPRNELWERLRSSRGLSGSRGLD